MPRRGKVVRRPTPPDARYNSVWVQIMINKVMKDGKKSTAERIVYNALGQVGERTKEDPRTVFEQAMRNTMPVLEVRPERRTSLSMRWIIGSARNRSEKSMEEKLAAELLDAANNRGTAVKKREDTHRMAEANKAFAHYRW